MVISTGMTLPRWDSVAALYCLQKSMMLTPCGPRAVPTGERASPHGVQLHLDDGGDLLLLPEAFESLGCSEMLWPYSCRTHSSTSGTPAAGTWTAVLGPSHMRGDDF